MSIVELSDIRKSYAGNPVLKGVSFAIERGEIFGIIGRNGAGKTTTVECIAGLRETDGGTIRVLGLDPVNDRDALRKVLGVQLQKTEFPPRAKVIELIRLYASFYENPANGDDLLAELGLSDKRRAAVGKLSGGQKQRLSIALALIGNPQVVILDELTTGLDPAARRETWRLIERIRDRGVTIILVTHFMDEAERLCDRLAVIEDGRASVDTPAGFARGGGSENELRFRLRDPLPDTNFAGLAGITRVRQEDGEIIVGGDGRILHSISSALLRLGIEPTELTLNRTSLEDAIIARSASVPTERSIQS